MPVVIEPGVDSGLLTAELARFSPRHTRQRGGSEQRGDDARAQRADRSPGSIRIAGGSPRGSPSPNVKLTRALARQ